MFSSSRRPQRIPYARLLADASQGNQALTISVDNPLVFFSGAGTAGMVPSGTKDRLTLPRIGIWVVTAYANPTPTTSNGAFRILLNGSAAGMPNMSMNAEDRHFVTGQVETTAVTDYVQASYFPFSTGISFVRNANMHLTATYLGAKA